MLPLGPRLIGQTEKTLDAALTRILREHDLSTSEWVALRLAADTSAVPLAAFVRAQAHFEDADDLVARLAARGLVAGDQLTGEGQSLIARITQVITSLTGSIWENLDPDDVAAAGRVLNAVQSEYRTVLAGLSGSAA
ncbi:hypothetical protein ACFXPA_21050 [Amycolatopsis sp. NPDC059090]|uniref:helix-turn-helix domain-containing protein n=1 Tax=unclassified Amycolatopsis TaxID=2618356 RepID=UPI00366DA371